MLLARKRILSGACPDLPFGDLIGIDDAPHADAVSTMCALVEQSVLRVWRRSRCMYQTNGADPNGPNELNPRQKLEDLRAAVEDKMAKPANDGVGVVQVAAAGRLLCESLYKVSDEHGTRSLHGVWDQAYFWHMLPECHPQALSWPPLIGCTI